MDDVVHVLDSVSHQRTNFINLNPSSLCCHSAPSAMLLTELAHGPVFIESVLVEAHFGVVQTNLLPALLDLFSTLSCLTINMMLFGEA